MAINDEVTEASWTVPNPILELRDVSVAFEMDRGQSRVLDGVNFDIERGEIIGIVGESGSGKSMFASALLDAVVEPGVLTGDIQFYPTSTDPVDILGLTKRELRELRWEDISMVFQGAMSSWNPTLSIRGHFKETLDAHDADFETGMDRARELLSDLYLDPDRVLDSYPHELSGGMKQRALIALAMVLEPKVLVMDEPTAALDLLMQRSILRLLKQVKEKYEITMVFITHDLPLVAELADRLAVMYAFEFVEVGQTEDILQNASHPYTRSLLNATPNLNADIEEMDPIPGSSPDPVDTPKGCSYHPRCPLADDECAEVDPDHHTVSSTHQAACFHWEQATEAIPFTLADASDRDINPGRPAPADRTKGTIRDLTNREDAILTIDNVEVHFEMNDGFMNMFKQSDVVRAVDGVSLDIPPNQVVALVGESGCGKTTLGKTAIGLQRPTNGDIKYRGQDIWAAHDGKGEVTIPYGHVRRALQIIHQDPGSSLNPNQRVMNILETPLKRWQRNLTRKDRRARIRGMLDRVGMSPPEDYAGRYPHQLSGGEKQRVALIRALLMSPDVILADEAISALDVSLRIEMMDLFLELQEQFDTSFLAISHDLSNARYLAEKADGLIGVMYLGKLVEIGPADQIINNPRHPYTQALRWATPDLHPEETGDELPMRKIDIPDPKNPPSGCRFHTRCPYARDVCSQEGPEQVAVDGEHLSACFRDDRDHEYWDEEPLYDSDGPADRQTELSDAGP